MVGKAAYSIFNSHSLGKDDGEVRVSSLIYVIGPEAEHLFGSLPQGKMVRRILNWS